MPDGLLLSTHPSVGQMRTSGAVISTGRRACCSANETTRGQSSGWGFDVMPMPTLMFQVPFYLNSGVPWRAGYLYPEVTPGSP